MPNQVRIYRLFKYKTITVNASCSPLTTNEHKTLQYIFNDKYKIPKNGYFYDRFFIGFDRDYILLDRNINIIDSNFDVNKNKTWNLKRNNSLKKFFCDIQKYSFYTSLTMSFQGVRIELCKHLHPQIINGINVNVDEDVKYDCEGLLANAYNPKKYCISKIKNTKSNFKKKNWGKCRDIKPEKWIKYSDVSKKN